MTYVVCEPCRDCKYTDCVTICPCDCFYEDGRMLYIDPSECIDCDACKPECPVDAIFQDIHVPAPWEGCIELNRERVSALKTGNANITERKSPLEAAGCGKR